MREMVFKNITSGDKKRRDLYITETSEQDGIKTVTQRHSIYIIKSHNKFNNAKELIDWQKTAPSNHNNRHIFIFKKRDTKSKKDIFICDVVGNVYAVVNSALYSVVFKHSFELDFLPTENK